MANKKTCGIYKITNTITNEVYIGKSKNIEGRFEEHKNNLNNGIHHNKGLQEDFDRTEGIFTNFKIYDYEIIEEVEDDRLEEEEVKLIEKYNSFKKGYNRTRGGQYDIHKGLDEWGGGRLLDPEERINLMEGELIKYINSIDMDSMNETRKREFATKLLKKTEIMYGYYQENPYSFYFDKVMEIDPNNKDIWYYKTKYFLKWSKYDEALKTIDKSIELKPENEKNWYLKAESLKGLRRYEEALEYNKKALEVEPNNEAVWIQKGQCFERLKKNDEAINSYEKAIKENPHNYKNWTLKFYCLKNSGRYEEAIECLKEALKIDSFREIYYKREIGECLEALGKYEEALSLYEKNKEYKIKAKLLQKLGRYEEAIEIYTEELKKIPNYTEYWYGKGKCLEKLKKYDEALECYNKTIALSKHNEKIWIEKARIYEKLGNYEEVIGSYNEAINQNPKNIDYWYEKIKYLEKLEKFDEAIECYDKIAEIYYDKEKIWIEKAKFCEKIGYYNQALETFSNIKYMYMKLEYWQLELNCMFKLERYDEAIHYYNELVEDYPFNEELREYSIEFLKILEEGFYKKELKLEEEEKWEEALEYCNKLIFIDDENQDYQLTKEKLLEKLK